MKNNILCAILCVLLFNNSDALTISNDDARLIGVKIWKNECSGKVEGLTCWNKGESFASMGIGHFLWFPAGGKDPFEETFPELLTYLEAEGVSIPKWLKSNRHCPWSSREEFYDNIHTQKMTELRQCLYETRHLQAIFIAKRLEKALPSMLKEADLADKEKVMANFTRLASDAQGLYALLDYMNFKGSGTSSKESYNGQRWGLLQVLQTISPVAKDPLADFITGAKFLLKRRVDNSPPERNEERWLKGWFNRLDSYEASP